MGKQWKQGQTIFLGSKSTADGDCNHEFRRHLLLGRRAMTNLDSVSRDITLWIKVCMDKAMIFPAVMYESESWTTKKAEHQRTDFFFNCGAREDSRESLELQGNQTSQS